MDRILFAAKLILDGATQDHTIICGQLSRDQLSANGKEEQMYRMIKCICTFIVAFSLGELTKVRIWHDNKFLKANWFLESVEIIDESNDEKYQFPCNRWLAKDKDDGSLIRELTCANAKKSNDSRSATSK